MYLIDSSYLIDYLNGVESVGEKLESLGYDLWATSVICVAEVLEGSSKKMLDKTEDLLSKVIVYNVNFEVARVFAELRRELRKRGMLLENMDLLIAATCLVNGLTLVTGNKKHFSRIRGLKILRTSTKKAANRRLTA